MLPEGTYHHRQFSTLVCSHMVTSPNATAAKMYVGVRVLLPISQRQFLEPSSKIFVASLEKSYQHNGGCKLRKKNEALNNVIIIHRMTDLNQISVLHIFWLFCSISTRFCVFQLRMVKILPSVLSPSGFKLVSSSALLRISLDLTPDS